MNEVARYAINGIVATIVHYIVLTFNLSVLNLGSAGIANFLAAFFGIATSFLGSRYFVFRQINQPAIAQAMKFGSLYALIALLHGVVLFAWSDILKFDYRFGFLLATLLQVSLSYLGNKVWVFRA